MTEKTLSDEVWKRLYDGWGSEWVARTSVEAFSGGLLNPKSMSNMDSLGTGPTRIQIGRKVVYPKRELIEWMKTRAN